MNLQYFLAKTDPETYSIEQFAKEGTTNWDGVKNPQALKAIRAMRPKDRVFIYHSMKDAAVVGLAEVVSDPVDIPSDPKLATVRMRLLRTFQEPVSLREIKTSDSSMIGLWYGKAASPPCRLRRNSSLGCGKGFQPNPSRATLLSRRSSKSCRFSYFS